MATPLIFEAAVSEAERPALASAHTQLAECLNDCRSIEFQVRDSISSIDFFRNPAIVVLSLMSDVARDEPVAQTEARWRELLSQLAKNSGPQIFVCTVFRRVPDDEDSSGRRRVQIMERIRRLDLMIAHLSHDFGINVVDIDRMFASIGARRLGTDYRLPGASAAYIAGFAIASAFLDVGLDDVIPADVLDRARARLRSQIEKAFARRLG